MMKDCFDQALCDPRAGEEATTKCGNTAASIIYFCSFYFLCSFLVSLNYLAVKTCAPSNPNGQFSLWIKF